MPGNARTHPMLCKFFLSRLHASHQVHRLHMFNIEGAVWEQHLVFQKNFDGGCSLIRMCCNRKCPNLSLIRMCCNRKCPNLSHMSSSLSFDNIQLPYHLHLRQLRASRHASPPLLGKEVVFLNDFQYDSEAHKWMPWSYFKNFLEGGHASSNLRGVEP